MKNQRFWSGTVVPQSRFSAWLIKKLFMFDRWINPIADCYQNTYPRPVSKAAMQGVWPRPACIHDPAGLLASCDICGERQGEANEQQR